MSRRSAKRKKILFITPPFHAGVVEVAGSWVPLYFVYLAGAKEAMRLAAMKLPVATRFVARKPTGAV